MEMAQKTLHGLAQSLTADDRFSLVIFAAQPKVLFKQLPGDQLKNSISEIAQLGSEEETNLGLGLDRSYAIARKGWCPKEITAFSCYQTVASTLGKKTLRF